MSYFLNRHHILLICTLCLLDTLSGGFILDSLLASFWERDFVLPIILTIILANIRTSLLRSWFPLTCSRNSSCCFGIFCCCCSTFLAVYNFFSFKIADLYGFNFLSSYFIFVNRTVSWLARMLSFAVDADRRFLTSFPLWVSSSYMHIFSLSYQTTV